MKTLLRRTVSRVPEDRLTLEFYAREAATYVQWSGMRQSPRLDSFLSNLMPGARILELGCGAGNDSARLDCARLRCDPDRCVA